MVKQMTKLNELIQQLCPDGVEYKTLGSFATISRGGNFQKKDFRDDGFPCIHYGQIYTKYGLFVDKTVSFISPACASKQKTASKNDIIMAVTSENIEDVCKCIVWLGDGEVAVSGHSAIIRHSQNPKYLAYYFHSRMFFDQKRKLAHGTKVIEVTPDKLASVKIPLPPIEVQREIVRILDNFTELTAELTAELSARKKQYEYYRDKLLTFDVFGGGTNRLEWKTLGESIISLSTGLNPRQFFKLNTEDAKNYYVTIREIQNGTIVFSEKTDRINDEALSLCNNRSHLEVGDVLFSGTGTIGETAIVSEVPTNWNIKEGVYAIKPKRELLNSRYLMYLLRTRYMQLAISKKVAGGTVKSIPMGDMRKLQIPVPDITVQESIVSILDRFDALCNDLTSGLPAEIAARQKQYEFYRDKLLTFKERISI